MPFVEPTMLLVRPIQRRWKKNDRQSNRA